MHPGVLSFLKDKRDQRIQACLEVLKHNETLVFGKSLSGYTQVRVVGPSMKGSIDSQLDEAVKPGRSLRFQAAKLLAPLVPGGKRRIVHSQYYPLPELAASELAEPLTLDEYAAYAFRCRLQSQRRSSKRTANRRSRRPDPGANRIHSRFPWRGMHR